MPETDNTLVNSIMSAFKQLKQEEHASKYDAEIAASALEQHKRATSGENDQKAILDALNSLNQRLGEMDKNNKDFSQLNKELQNTVDGIGKISDNITAEKIRGNNAGVEDQLRQFGVFATMVQNEFKQRTFPTQQAQQQTYAVSKQGNPDSQQNPLDNNNTWLSNFIKELRSDTSKGVETSKKATASGSGTGVTALAAKANEDTARQAIDSAEKNADQMFKTNTERPTMVLLKKWLEKRLDKEDEIGSGAAAGGAGGGGVPWWLAALGIGAGGLLPGATGGYLGNLLNRFGNWVSGKTDAKEQAKQAKAENKKAAQEQKAKVKEAKANEKAAKEDLKRAKADEKAAKQEAKQAKANEKAATSEAEQQKAKAETEKAKQKSKAAKEQTKQAKQNVKDAKAKTAKAKAPKPVKGINPAGTHFAPKIPGGSVIGKGANVLGKGLMVAPGVFAGIEAAGKAMEGDTFGATTAATKGVIDTALNFNPTTATANFAMTGAMMGLKALGIADENSPETLGELVQFTADGLKQNSGWIFGNEREEQVARMAGAHGKDLMAAAKIGTAQGTGKNGEHNIPISAAFMSSQKFKDMIEPYNKIAAADAKEKTSLLFQSDKYEKLMNEMQSRVKEAAMRFAQQYMVLSKEYGEENVQRMLSGEGGVEAMQEYIAARYDASNPDFATNLSAAKEKIGAQIRGEVPTAPETETTSQKPDEIQSQMAAASPENTPETGRETTETSSGDVDVEKANGGMTEEKMKAACYDGFLSALLDPRVIESNAQNNEAIGQVLSRVMVG